MFPLVIIPIFRKCHEVFATNAQPFRRRLHSRSFFMATIIHRTGAVRNSSISKRVDPTLAKN
jgi:hypothetical protein